jgi:Rrf2 family protein
MLVSTKGRYALRLMLDIASRQSDENVSLKDIAERQDISMKYLEQIAGFLSRAGFVRSARGARGGYRLTREPSLYTVGSVLRVTEGSMRPVSCMEESPTDCPRADTCLTHGFWTGLDKAVNQYLDSVTLADLIKEGTDI